MLTYIYTARDTASNKKVKSTVQAESPYHERALELTASMVQSLET